MVCIRGPTVGPKHAHLTRKVLGSSATHIGEPVSAGSTGGQVSQNRGTAVPGLRSKVSDIVEDVATVQKALVYLAQSS